MDFLNKLAKKGYLGNKARVAAESGKPGIYAEDADGHAEADEKKKAEQEDARKKRRQQLENE